VSEWIGSFETWVLMLHAYYSLFYLYFESKAKKPKHAHERATFITECFRGIGDETEQKEETKYQTKEQKENTMFIMAVGHDTSPLKARAEPINITRLRCKSRQQKRRKSGKR
jgi:hypothetical protein